jgi:hypothetical protein
VEEEVSCWIAKHDNRKRESVTRQPWSYEVTTRSRGRDLSLMNRKHISMTFRNNQQAALVQMNNNPNPSAWHVCYVERENFDATGPALRALHVRACRMIVFTMKSGKRVDRRGVM